MMVQGYDTVICGAGIAGVAAAHSLTKLSNQKILLIDSDSPLSLTSDKSTECYRNWWLGSDGAMLGLMNRSIGLMEELASESENRFLLNPHGYLFATAKTNEIANLERQADKAERVGAGEIRKISRLSQYKSNSGACFIADQAGSDLITNKMLIQELFPYLNKDTVAVLHARRCGSLSAQQLGMYLLEKARDNGCDFKMARFVGIETEAGQVTGVNLEIDGREQTISTNTIVFSAGPHLGAVLERVGIKLPILVEKHVKISLPDPLGVVPRDAPLIIWNDSIRLPWSEQEKHQLKDSSETRWLLEEFVPGVHGRPVGAGNQVLMYWTYESEVSQHPEFPIEWDPYLPEVTLRGMAVMVPGLSQYFDPMPRPYVDGGYYTKTQENRPVIGPIGPPGVFLSGAFSGFGIMAACGAGELLARHVLNKQLPHYAMAFMPTRFNDPAYLDAIKNWDEDGQL